MAGSLSGGLEWLAYINGGAGCSAATDGTGTPQVGGRAAVLLPRCEGRGGINGAIESGGGHVGDADGLTVLVQGHAGFVTSIAATKSVAAVTFGSVPAAPVVLLEKLPAPPHGPRLDAVGHLPQRVVVGLLGV